MALVAERLPARAAALAQPVAPERCASWCWRFRVAVLLASSAMRAEPKLVADASRVRQATRAIERLTPALVPSEREQTRRAAARRSTTSGMPEVALINDAIRKGWADHNLVPSKAATDGEWCRRVYLDLIGRVPTVDELTGVSGRSQARQAGAARRSAVGRRVHRRVRAQLDDDLDEHSHRPHGRHGAAVARRSRRHAAVSHARRCSTTSRTTSWRRS